MASPRIHFSSQFTGTVTRGDAPGLLKGGLLLKGIIGLTLALAFALALARPKPRPRPPGAAAAFIAAFALGAILATTGVHVLDASSLCSSCGVIYFSSSLVVRVDLDGLDVPPG